jgi:uncharacterized integral membrane protein (TIGR00697 family)
MTEITDTYIRSTVSVRPSVVRRGLMTYRLLPVLLVLNVAFQLISDVTAGKIILLFGVGVSVTVLYFPIVYVISDVLTEVYGYAVARSVLWYTLIASVIAGLFYQLAVFVPAAPFFGAGDAYATVFGIVPRVLIGGWLAVFLGDICNNYILAKMKVWTEGKWLWSRTITSTVFGQLVNTTVFYLVALSGVLPRNVLIQAILLGWIAKTAVEVLMTPLTYAAVGFVKRIEGVDHYDRDTDFNPFSFKLSDPVP